jgi:hypothetical protein
MSSGINGFIILLIIVLVVGGIWFWVSVLKVATKAVNRMPKPVENAPATDDDSKTCPQCAETIKQAATMCRYCQYEYPA